MYYLNFSILHPRPQSKLSNNEPVSITGNLTIKLQKNVSGNWYDKNIPVNNIRIRIPANGLIKLDTGLDNLNNQAFAGFNNLNVVASSAGQYRVHARFEIPETRQVIEESWEFDVR